MNTLKRGSGYERCNNNFDTADICRRACQFYLQAPNTVVSNIWKEIGNKFHQQILFALVTQNDQALQKELAKLYDGLVLFGTDYAHTGEADHMAEYLRLFDTGLLNLATACGIIREFNPEQPVDAEYECSELISRVENFLGIPLSVAGVNGMPVVTVNGRYYSYRMFWAATTLLQIQRECWVPNRVLEIGSGVGRETLLLAKAGAKCHTYDLPVMSVLCFYVLCHELPPSTIWLQGESWNPDASVYIHGVDPDDIPRVDVVLNKDSLPEFAAESADIAIRLIKYSLLIGGRFFSSNHESTIASQHRVSDMVDAVGGFTRCSRSPSWMRKGYVDEIFKRISDSGNPKEA